MENFIFTTIKEKLKDKQGENLIQRIKNDLNIEIKDLRIVNCYLIDGNFTEKELKEIAEEIFTDKIIENFKINEEVNELFTNKYDYLIHISLKPGVTDNTGKTSKIAIKDYLKNLKQEFEVYYSKIYFLKGVSYEDALKISDYLSNKLINNITIFEKILDLKKIKAPKVLLKEEIKVEQINLEVSDEELINISGKRVLALSLEEMQKIRDYFRQKNRNPTDVEIECLAQTWSEHCKHKIFNAEIEYIEKNNGKEKREIINSLFKTYIVGATEKIKENLKKKEKLVSVFEDNAGIIKFNENLNCAIKVETHNAPSALDPYGGALTGILGVNRDILGVGLGAKPIANIDVFCFGDINYKEKLPEKVLHPKRIFEGVIKGIEDGGNKSGIPTVNGAILFDNSFLGKPLVFCGTIGIMNAKIKGKPSHIKEISNNDYAVMVGGKVGKDGIHGATFSSESLTESSPVSAVQIGDPITQKKMTDFLLDARDKLLYKAITDNGAGGLSSSIGELAKITNGCEIYLDKVPLKYSGLQPWEILVSESQERMTVVVDKENLEKFLNLSKQYDVESTVVGKFTTSGKFIAYYYDAIVAEIDMDFLHNGCPIKKLKGEWNAEENENNKRNEDENEEYNLLNLLKNKSFGELLKELLSSLNIASKENIIRRYDHEVKGNTIIKPLMGKNTDGLSDGAVIRIDRNSDEGLVIANGINPKYSEIDTYATACNAVNESIRNILCCGGNFDEIYLVDNFCWPSPLNDKFKTAQLVRACKGLYDSCIEFSTPCISGKDSMSIDFSGIIKENDKIKEIKISGKPTLLITAISKIDNIKEALTPEVKNTGDLIYVIGITRDELGGSELYNKYNIKSKKVPKVNFKESKEIFKRLNKAIREKLLNSCHDCSECGIAVALAEISFSGNLGIEINLKEVPNEIEGNVFIKDLKILFSESQSRFVVSIDLKNKEKFESIMGNYCKNIGVVRKDKEFIIKGINGKIIIKEKIDVLKECWKNGLKI